MNITDDKKPAAAFKITGDWKEQSTKLRATYPQLTAEDVKFEVGHENDLLKRVEKRLTKNRQEAINIIKKAQPVRPL